MANVIHFDQGKTVSGEVEYVLVGAGLPRTGTLSTMTALELLLPGRCHHMTRTFSSLADHEFWHQASQGQLKDQDWREFIRASKLSASVDFPMSLYWRDLARLYPQAKVILTVRDPVRWYHSVRNTIRQFEITLRDSLLGAPLRYLATKQCLITLNHSKVHQLSERRQFNYCCLLRLLWPNLPRA